MSKKQALMASPDQNATWVVLNKACERLKFWHAHRATTKKPFVTVSYAQSVDGSIATKGRLPLALSCPESLALTHGLRAVHASILVGIGCVLADNPRLTVRLRSGSNPQPVILDSNLRCPLSANLFQTNGIAPLILTTDKADIRRQEALEQAGARVVKVKGDRRGRIHLPAALEAIADIGLNSVMVEGGARVITSFLTDRLVNQVVITVAPLFVGGLRAPLGTFRRRSVFLPRLVNTFFQQVGDDVVMLAEASWENDA